MHGSGVVQRGGFYVSAEGGATVQLAGLGARWMVRGLENCEYAGWSQGHQNVQVEVNSCQTTGKSEKSKKTTKYVVRQNINEKRQNVAKKKSKKKNEKLAGKWALYVR